MSKKGKKPKKPSKRVHSSDNLAELRLLYTIMGLRARYKATQKRMDALGEQISQVRAKIKLLTTKDFGELPDKTIDELARKLTLQCDHEARLKARCQQMLDQLEAEISELEQDVLLCKTGKTL
jgi:hypothetical protein